LAGVNKKQIGGDFNKMVIMEENKAHAKKQNLTPSKAAVPVDKCGVPKETAASLKARVFALNNGDPKIKRLSGYDCGAMELAWLSRDAPPVSSPSITNAEGAVVTPEAVGEGA